MVAAACLTAAAWSAARYDLFPRDDLAWQLGQTPAPVAVRGRVVASPRLLSPPATALGQAVPRLPASDFVVVITSMRDGERWRPVSGRATVIVRGEPARIVAGTHVQVWGRGLRPMPACNPGEFDFAIRALADRCLSIVRVAGWEAVDVLSCPSLWSPGAALDRLRMAAAAVLTDRISPGRAPLAAALLLGQRDSLPRAAADDFVITGTIHVLAISGLHVGLLAGGLFALLRGLFVPRSQAILVVAVVTGLYAALVGAETPVVRATLLVWAACLAAIVSRRAATINALAAAAIVLVAWRPAEAFTAGAQLSFLSTAVLVRVASATPRVQSSDPIERLIDRSRSRWEKLIHRWARRAAVASLTGLAVWLAAAPLVASRFHVVSPVGLLANLLVAPLIPLAMACGFLCLLTAVVSSTLASVFAAGCDGTLAMIQGIVAWAAAVPAGHAWVAGPAGWWVIGWYTILVVAVVWGRRDLLARPSTWGALAGSWAGIGLVAMAIGGLSRPSPAGLRVVMSAVGHGCGIVIRTPLGRCMLYDAGRLGAATAAGRSLSAVLWSEGIPRIDTLVISHADADHFNAVPELLSRFPVGEVLVPKAFLSSDSLAVAELVAQIADRGVPLRTAVAGDSFAIDSLCRVRVLHPHAGQADGERHNDNASSLVLSVDTAGRRLLLTGDLEGPALAAFAAASPGQCDVLMAPHHGSRTSLPADIARATTPRVVLVSGRGGQAWPEVREAYAAAVGGEPATVVKTGGEGALAVTLVAGGVSMERFSAGRWRVIPMTPDAQETAGPGALVRSQPPTSKTSWLATYAPRSIKTPLVKP